MRKVAIALLMHSISIAIANLAEINKLDYFEILNNNVE